MQWLSVSRLSREVLDGLARAFLKQSYEDEKGWGYRLVEVRPNHILGSLIEREKKTELITDPFGESRAYETIRFNQTVFRLQVGWPQLELIDVPRSIAVFLNSLGELSNFKIGVEQIDLAPSRWIEVVCRKHSNAKVVRAHLSNISLSNETSAAIAVSGTEDVQEFLPQMVKGRTYLISNVQVQFDVDGKAVKFEISEGAKAKILSKDIDMAARLLREMVFEFGPKG